MEKKRYRLLLVDDSTVNLVLLEDVLKCPEYEILTARNAASAFKIASEKKPDLIVLDIAMPGIDGFQLFQMLKDHEACDSIPVMFLTSLDEPEVCSRAMEMGALDCLVKPVGSEILCQKVAGALKAGA